MEAVMPRFHVHDSPVRRYRDQEEESESVQSEILQRLDRIEQAIVLLAGGTNGNEGEQGDEQDPGVGAESYSGKQRIGYNIKTDRDAQSKRLFGSDDLVVKGNLSKHCGELDLGQRYPDDLKARGTNDSAQAIRDRFMSRNPTNAKVVAINTINRRKYG
jgi:hypothetical protein